MSAMAETLFDEGRRYEINVVNLSTESDQVQFWKDQREGEVEPPKMSGMPGTERVADACEEAIMHNAPEGLLRP
jgi:hypothetical protein